MPFINRPGSSSNLTILIISFISSFKIVNVAVHGSNIFLWIAASAAASNGIKNVFR